MIQILFLYLIVASTFTFGKMLLVYLPPIFLIGLRMVVAGSIILLVNYISGKKISIQKEDIVFFFILSWIHIFIPYVAEFVGLASMSPSCAALIYNLMPCFTALFAYIIFKERMTVKKWLGFLIGLIGVMYMIPRENFICYQHFNIGYLLMLLSVISCSLGWTLVKKLIQKGYGTLQVNGYAMLLGGLESLIVAHFFETPPISRWYENMHFWVLFAAIIIIANFIFYNFYGFLLHKYSATLLSFIGFLTPLFTALYDFIFLGISIGIEFYIATVIVAYGIYIFYQEELRQGYIE
ncbi:DMT family transporter [Candidatus Dependentiae bacterium]|nr:DMT family transporter [Candidatus Dependentiae bacterium]